MADVVGVKSIVEGGRENKRIAVREVDMFHDRARTSCGVEVSRVVMDERAVG